VSRSVRCRPDAGLDAFAAGFGEMLATWERLIGEAADRF
jgi:hypothetical protein